LNVNILHIKKTNMRESEIKKEFTKKTLNKKENKHVMEKTKGT